MTFTYDAYYAANYLQVLIPFIFICMIGIAAFVHAIVRLIIKLVKRAKQRQTNIRTGDTIAQLVASVVLVATLGRGLWRILYLNGGIYLPSEREDAAITRTGIVECITERTPSNALSKYEIDQDPGYSWGSYVTIDGIRYSVVLWEGVEVGDTVTISCLPKSRCILSYEKVEPQPIDLTLNGKVARETITTDGDPGLRLHSNQREYTIRIFILNKGSKSNKEASVLCQDLIEYSCSLLYP